MERSLGLTIVLGHGPWLQDRPSGSGVIENGMKITELQQLEYLTKRGLDFVDLYSHIRGESAR